ncbi:MAG TPA: pilus (MSHA type) biogenesis protein MshL [Campylobacterales bacterium]|nr:pilus (MSHA type) biogenesis protein MshL [Campylobacterales bacterium]
MRYFRKRLHKLLLSSLLLMSVISPSMANRCSTQMFTVTLNSSLTYGDVLENLADECGLTLLVKDAEAKMKLQENIYFVKLNNASLEELLDVVLKENNVGYELEGNKLRIYYLQTKTFNLHYIAGTRVGKSNAHVTIANNNGSDGASAGGSDDGALTAGTSGSKTGVSIESSDDFQFWSKISEELHALINRPEDSYEAPTPIINPEAGMITVTGTTQQLARIGKYVDEVTAQLKNQVLIDVKILSVTFDDSATTGVDWSQLYSLQDMAISTFQMAQNNVAGLTWTRNESGNTQIDEVTPQLGSEPRNASALIAESSTNITDVIRFLKTQGDVKSISNPKIMTLNNQPALISVGNELFYKIQSNAILQNNTGSGLATQGETIDSVFAGILLDITPEISDDGSITLKINPSISDTINTVERDNGGSRDIPPDLSRKQISSVVTVRDGQHVILGGLISSKSGKKISKVPLLGDLPLLDQLFKREVKIENVDELVLILTPHIIKHNTDISLEDLGYRKLKDEK